MSGRAAPGRVARRTDPRRAPTEHAVAPYQNDPIEAVAFLQQSCGNAAVSRMLAGPAAGSGQQRRLARYESGEHAMLGGKLPMVSIGGVLLSQGDVIALGDLYETPEDVLRAPQEELAKLVELIHRDREFYENRKGTPVGNEEWEAATRGRKSRPPTEQKKTYMELAEANDPHFAPPKAGGTGQDHKTEWERLHKKALDHAHTYPNASPAEAKFFNNFASHFLTDAFSAGHTVAKSDILDAARAFWSKLLDAGGTTNFTETVARRVLADSGAARKLAEYELTVTGGFGLVNIQGEFTVDRFAQLLNLIAFREQDRFLSAFAKIVHDELNEGIATKGGGIEVENAAGDRWKLSGDKTLGKSPETMKIAQKALAQSEANLRVATTTQGPLDYQQLFDEVWKFVPRPSATGAKEVQATIDTFADAANPKAVDEFVKLTIAELSIALEVLEAGGHVRKRVPAKVP